MCEGMTYQVEREEEDAKNKSENDEEHLDARGILGLVNIFTCNCSSLSLTSDFLFLLLLLDVVLASKGRGGGFGTLRPLRDSESGHCCGLFWVTERCKSR